MVRWKFSRFVILSLVVTAYGLSAPLLFSFVATPIVRLFVHSTDPLMRAFPLRGAFWGVAMYELAPALWLLIFITGLAVYRWRGLWLIFEAPFVSFWMLFLIACAPYSCP